MEEEKTKKCSRCGRELPLSEFPVNKGCKDGHTGQCKRCKVELARERRERKRGGQNKLVADKGTVNPMVAHNPKFKDMTPRVLIADMREIINELRARGYNYDGKLTYLQTINL